MGLSSITPTQHTYAILIFLFQNRDSAILECLLPNIPLHYIVYTVHSIEDWTLRGTRSSSFWLPRNGLQLYGFWIWSETECKLLQNMVHNTFQHSPTLPPQSHPMIYTAPCVMFLMRADTLGGEVGEWGWRWISRILWAPVKWHEPIGECYLGPKKQQFTSWVENTNNEWVYLQSSKSVKQNDAKSVNRSPERKADI